MSQPQPFHSYSFDVWTDQRDSGLPMVVTRYGLNHEDTLAAVRADLKPGILVTPRTHNRARCCPPHIAVRGSTRDEYQSPQCGKHVPGTCNGYGTECSPRHTPDEIMAHRRAARDGSPAPELTAYLRECYPQLAEASSRRYDDPHTAI